MVTYRTKRIYEAAEEGNGYRVLVDRLWPRGVSKENAALDEWNKDIAPSSELRTWYGHAPERLAEFSARYEAELRAGQALADFKKRMDSKPFVTLLYAAKEPRLSHALVLKKVLERQD